MSRAKRRPYFASASCPSSRFSSRFGFSSFVSSSPPMSFACLFRPVIHHLVSFLVPLPRLVPLLRLVARPVSSSPSGSSGTAWQGTAQHTMSSEQDGTVPHRIPSPTSKETSEIQNGTHIGTQRQKNARRHACRDDKARRETARTDETQGRHTGRHTNA